MRIVELLLASWLLISCADSGENTAKVEEKDTTASSENLGPDLAVLRREYEQEYNRDYKWSVIAEDSFYRFDIQHICLKDSALIVPSKYNFDTQKEFVTHNFITQVIILRGSYTVATRRITKADFKTELSPELDSFAVLLPPTCKAKGSELLMHYSISIPLTDVGMGVSAIVDTLGKISIDH